MDASSPPRNMLDLAPSIRQSGFRLIDAGELYELLRSILGIVGGLTAVGTTQATGLPLSTGISVITTSTAGSGVVLPVGVMGQEKTVVNTGAAATLVYGNGGDQIIPLASSTPAATLSVPAGQTAVLACINENFATSVATWKVISMG